MRKLVCVLLRGVLVVIMLVGAVFGFASIALAGIIFELEDK